MAVYLTGTENLPPFIKSMLDSNYNYHSHQLTCEPSKDGFDYKYSLVVSKVPLDQNNTQSEYSTTNSSYLSSTDSSQTTQTQKYCFNPVKCSKSVKCVMMVHVKFILLHMDMFGNRLQSMFSEELSSEETLHDVIMNFRDVCIEKLPKKMDFNPRMSYCIGEVTRKNSKPVLPEDLSKKIFELANQQSVVGKITLVADTLSLF